MQEITDNKDPVQEAELNVERYQVGSMRAEAKQLLEQKRRAEKKEAATSTGDSAPPRVPFGEEVDPNDLQGVLDVPFSATADELAELEKLENTEKGQTYVSQIYKALPQAANDILEFSGDIESALTGDEPTAIQFLDENGGFISPRLVTGEDAKSLLEQGVPDFTKLPEFEKADSEGKQAIRDISSFMFKFFATRGALGKAGASPEILKDTLAAGMTGLTEDPDQEGLAEFTQNYPAVGQVFTALLNDEEDGPMIKRLKNGAEEAGFGLLFEKFIQLAKGTVGKAMGGNGGKEVLSDVEEFGDELFYGLGDLSEDVPAIGKGSDFKKRTPVDAKGRVKKFEGETDPDLIERGLVEIGQEGKEKLYLNLARISAPDDIKDVLDTMTASFSKELDEAKRGKISNEKTQELADTMGMSVRDLLSRRSGEALNAEQAVAARSLLVASGDKLLELSRRAADPNATKTDAYLFRRALSAHRAIQSEVVGARAEAGRALQSWNIPVGKGERVKAIEQMLGANGGETVSRELAKRLAQINNPGGLAAAARRGFGAATMDAVKESYVIGLLWTPSTHIVNLTGNTIATFQSILDRGGAEALNRFAGREGAVAPGEAMAMITAVKGGFMDSLIHAYRSSTGQSAEIGFANRFRFESGTADAAISAESFGISQTRLGKVIDITGNAVRGPSVALEFNDELFKSIGFRMELRAQAYRRAYNSGLRDKDLLDEVAKLVNDPPEDIKLEAVDAALYNTFQNKTGAIGEAIQKIKQSGNVSGALATSVFPFARTPVNLFRYSFEHSPAAPVVGQWREAIEAGGAEREIAISKWVGGTLTAGLLFDFAQAGYITGGGPASNNKSQQEARRRLGVKDYSLTIGDTMVGLQRYDPVVATSAGIAADLVDLQSRWDFPDVGETAEIFESFAIAQGRLLSNKSYLRQVGEIASALTETQEGVSSLKSVAGNTAGALVPFSTLLSSIERVDDPATREAMTILQHVQARLPVLSKSLIPRRDAWGEVITPSLGAAAVVSPSDVAVAKDSPIDREIIRTQAAVSKIPWRNVSFDGVKVDFVDYPEVLDEYRRLAGNELKHPAYGLGLKDHLNAVVTGKSPESLLYDYRSDDPKGGRASYIESQVRIFRERARREILTSDKYDDNPQFKNFRVHVQKKKAEKPRDSIFEVRPETVQ